MKKITILICLLIGIASAQIPSSNFNNQNEHVANLVQDYHEAADNFSQTLSDSQLEATSGEGLGGAAAGGVVAGAGYAATSLINQNFTWTGLAGATLGGAAAGAIVTGLL